ncbi:sialin isoform X2 [Diachasma alloeum]|uniref:sialin isoform X2 n=1 Tax=Diachasma alloeum TaxID=454923 RepID=UPI0007382AD2|nr:sialin isoform X2 [Diachasma alloeum]XP_015126415.1 sialin isoform X2 [Diachasma alloeum]XP_015126417.1 sialin isoform X2 [Diachasma alloeum]XP_015126418.1 sialin isoform X2 [Diachasma alloeum]XP_015126419.1 sialin isoform X2 [Diachasma alloeum]XP_015126420.1 sialin isoform X2 [Diachasma alloeum]
MAGYVRFAFAMMLCIANMIIYGLKVNISTTIIGMVKVRNTSDASTAVQTCPDFENTDSTSGNSGLDIHGPYNWSAFEQGLVVSLYFAGYMAGMFPAGYFADRFNTKYVLLTSVLLNSLFTLLVPMAAESIGVLFFLRFMTGLVSAANLPVVNVLVGKWVVYEEKSTWVAIINAGTSIGTVISIFTSGNIMKDIGWESVFYIHGALPLVWCAVFAFFFADNPETQKIISEPERELIVNSYGHRKPQSGKSEIPWRDIFTSKPFWALVATNTLGNFCWYFMLTQLPLYMSKMLRFDIKSNAAISCSPYLINAITNPLLGRLLDWGRKKGFWSQTNGRKIAVGVSCIPPSILMLAIAYSGCERIGATVMLVISIVICGAIFVGHLTNQNDLAPNYAGILMGITNTPGTISAFILPAIVGELNEKGHTFESWRYVFWLSIICQLGAFVIFVLFGSAKIQEWNYPKGSAERNALRNGDRADADASRMI